MDADESRPENRRARPLEPAELPAGPERDLHKALYQLYAEADCPRLDELVRMIAADDRLPGAPKKDLISKIIRADGLGSQQDTVTVAVALARAAGREDTARTAERVRRLWVAARTTPTPRLPLDDLVENYLARLRGRYGQLDIDSLLPLDSQEERIPIGVREVFVAQHVRADPPPVELPRELWHRLAESGAVEDRDLPEDLDRTILARVRQSYEARPARPVLDVLAEPGGQRTVVLGDPGAGKSTLARYLAVALAQRTDGVLPAALNGLLPVLIELRGYAEPRWRDSSFLDYLDQQHRYTDDRLGLPRDLLERLLNGYGQVLFVFDGLDELFDRKDRETVSHQITGFAARYPGARVLVTSRYVGYQRGAFDAAGFSHHMLQDLHRDQIAGFAQRWYRIACPGNPADAVRLKDRLLTAIDGSRAVRELAGNPLLLTILAVIGRRRELPRDRRSVYEHAVTVLVEHWEVSKHLAAAAPGLPELDREDKLELLRLIARRMQDGPSGLAGNHIAGADLLTMFETYLRESHALVPGPARVAARAMLEQFRHRNFILSRFGGSVYGFVHRAFLEYLAAADIDIRFANRELSENDLIEGVFFRRYNDPAWHEVLLLLTGMREHFAGAIIDRLLTADPLWYVHPNGLPQHLLLAIRCLAEIRKPGGVHRQSIAIARALADLLETVVGQPSNSALPTAIRQTVVPVMTSLGPRWTGRDHYLGWYRVQIHTMSDADSFLTEAVPLATLIAAVLDPSDTFHQRLRATAVLATHSTLRRAAVQAIAAGWADDPGTLSWLRDRFIADPDGFVRRTVVQAVGAGWADDPGTLSWLRDRFIADPDGFVRRTVVQAVGAGWADDPGTLPWLRDCSGTDADGSVREVAVQAIVAGWADDPGTVRLLHERFATDPDGSVRRAVVLAIAAGWADDPGTLSWLRDCSATDADASVREVAVQAIAAGWADDSGTLSWLRDCSATDADGSVREVAVQAIAAGWADDSGTLSWLRGRVTTDSDLFVRRVAVRAIAAGWADDSETLSWLRGRVFADADGSVREAAVRAIAVGWAEDPGTLPWLRERATTDPDEFVRRAVAQTIAVGWAEDPGTLPWLRERATTDPDGSVRQVVLQAVAAGWADDSGTLSWLRGRVFADADGSVREIAVRAIAAGWADDPGTLPLLRDRAINDVDRFVRQVAVLAIAAGWADDAGTLPLLRDHATTDLAESVRRAAVLAIAAGWADDPGTLPLLRDRATNDVDRSVREAAAQEIAVGWPDDRDADRWNKRPAAEPRR
ncbi:HEAT repeat domain-containing protein [Actinoplanes regularis]|uniref:HEAT repeat domain-containing protein n=1 Tax=Actinoplanes regularis TaxID=52697 RepID=UPI0024A57F56|nr:HEAT repeat domain-containing protein [Actinoplanes regularis]GLW28525.1 hypothetical protein Areg01_14650 [Actinoplanes regularis]